MEDNQSQDKPHVYDGIVEENNPMPLWWVILFFLCCSYAFLYWLHYTSGSGPTLLQEYKQNLAQFEKQVLKNAPAAGTEDEATLMAYMSNEHAIHEGAELFAAKCAMCHGEKLEGKIGPNLTDHFWTTGDGSRKAIVQTIMKGSAAKGMPPWEGALKPNDIKDVAAFIYSKIDSKPPNAKAPEGNEAK